LVNKWVTKTFAIADSNISANTENFLKFPVLKVTSSISANIIYPQTIPNNQLRQHSHGNVIRDSVHQCIHYEHNSCTGALMIQVEQILAWSNTYLTQHQFGGIRHISSTDCLNRTKSLRSYHGCRILCIHLQPNYHSITMICKIIVCNAAW